MKTLWNWDTWVALYALPAVIGSAHSGDVCNTCDCCEICLACIGHYLNLLLKPAWPGGPFADRASLQLSYHKSIWCQSVVACLVLSSLDRYLETVLRSLISIYQHSAIEDVEQQCIRTYQRIYSDVLHLGWGTTLPDWFPPDLVLCANAFSANIILLLLKHST